MFYRAASSRFRFFSRLFLVLVIWAGTTTSIPASEENPYAEKSYKQFLSIYRKEQATKTELQNALSFLETANNLAPNTYKYVFSLGALNSTLERWEKACEWFEKAKALISSDQQRSEIQIEFEYCQAQLAKLRVSKWSGEGVSISFIMKEGTVELDRDAIDKLPKRLPIVNVGEPSNSLEAAIQNKLSSMTVRFYRKDPFLIVALRDATSPEVHYEKGIKDFYQYFSVQYFTQLPRRLLVVIISSAPYPLVEATRLLYPEVRIPVYAPFLGYYNPADNLIMATGGSAGYGTLLHEMIHALIESDFPQTPPWLNEGLASLYERSQWTSGRLNALPNWRLDRMRLGDIPSFLTLEHEAARIGLHSSEIAPIRLFLLYLDQRHQVADVYRMMKQGGPEFSMEKAINNLKLNENDWRSFAQNTFRDYRTEMAQGRSEPSNPDEVRFVQQALNLILGAELKVDGFWGESTQAKLVVFQQRFNLKPDGKLGSQTKNELKRQDALKRLTELEKN